LESSEPAIEQEVYEPGSEADFERLYRSSYRRILATLIGLLGDRHSAEDCAQDAFMRAYRGWSAWRPEAPAEAWVHRIAINAAISYRRRERLRQVGEVMRRLGRPGHPPDPAEVLERSELLTALLRLPGKQAAALVLRHYHGYSNREIATALGVPEPTIASRLAAARRKLKRVLAATRAQGNG